MWDKVVIAEESRWDGMTGDGGGREGRGGNSLTV